MAKTIYGWKCPARNAMAEIGAGLYNTQQEGLAMDLINLLHLCDADLHGINWLIAVLSLLYRMEG